MSNNETHADIIAELRGYSSGMPPSYHVTMTWHDFRIKLDRIEAAHKRECGNTAVMREALSDACYAMFNFLKTQNGGYEEMANALDKAKAALAAPPRNCDIPHSDEHELWLRWQDHCSKIYPKTIKFSTWLLATANEEGGAK